MADITQFLRVGTNWITVYSSSYMVNTSSTCRSTPQPYAIVINVMKRLQLDQLLGIVAKRKTNLEEQIQSSMTHELKWT